MNADSESQKATLVVAAMAAFSTYFCMYAFRKPFTAASYADQQVFGTALKTTLVLSQLIGYMLSKFIGIRVIAEMPRKHRALTLIAFIAFAELALVGFAYLPVEAKPVALFLNGLPLGMIFGLVLSYLEGRRQTEALTAALCASFIISSGTVKSVGRWLVLEQGVSEFSMPMWTGAIFFPPLLLSVWLLQRTPPPDSQDRKTRQPREAMSARQRRMFLTTYGPGLALIVLVYVSLTVVRTIRDDYAVEIWTDLGVDKTPTVFVTSETVVAVVVTLLAATAIWIKGHTAALRATLGLMILCFALLAISAFGQDAGTLSPMTFMVVCGVAMYVPYVTFHTTVFERFLAASRLKGNLGFLMYIADALGYCGYAAVLAFGPSAGEDRSILAQFRGVMVIVAAVCVILLLLAMAYIRRNLKPV